MYYYYRYIFANQNLKAYKVWDYSKEIINALKCIYKSDLIAVDFSDAYYGFWLNRQKQQYEHNQVGKIIAASVSNFNSNKSIYSYNNSNGTTGTSTQIFIEDTSARKSQNSI